MRAAAFLAAALAALSAPAAAQDKPTPYWASIASGKAMARAGPGRTYPGVWLYQRRDLPVRVLKVYDNWRLIEDPDGDRGWMLVSLMSGERTAIVKAGAPQAVREKPAGASRTAYLAEGGAIGKVDRCDGQWCRIAFGRKRGWIAQQALYGVAAGEVFKD